LYTISKVLSNPLNSTYEENNQSLFQTEAIQVDERYVHAGGGAQRRLRVRDVIDRMNDRGTYSKETIENLVNNFHETAMELAADGDSSEGLRCLFFTLPSVVK